MQQSLSTFNHPEVAGQSVEGPSHRKDDIGCQDSWAAKKGESYVVVAVGDGLGSAKRSAEGSQIATKIAATELNKWLQSDEVEIDEITQSEARKAFQHAIIRARKNIERVAAEFGTKRVSHYSLVSLQYSRLACSDCNW